MLRWLFLIVVVLNVALFAWFEREQQMRSHMADRPQGFDQYVAPLTLLSEVQQQLRERGANNQALPSSLPAGDSEQPVICVEIRNFSSQQEMVSWQARLPAEAAVFTGDGLSEDEYWVYIEAPDSLQSRQKLLQELRDLGLEVSLIQRGEHKGSLSLGRYSDRELAEALYKGVLSQGYAGRLLSVGTGVDDLSLWISLKGPLASDLKWLDDMLVGTAYLKSEKKVCQGVASSKGHE